MRTPTDRLRALLVLLLLAWIAGSGCSLLRRSALNKAFESVLNRALATRPDARPDTRLLNLVMQRRARWLLS